MSTVGGGNASYGDIENFYGQWKANLSTDMKEQAAFAALSDDDKTIVLLAFKSLSKRNIEGNLGTIRSDTSEPETDAPDNISLHSIESIGTDGSSMYSYASGDSNDSDYSDDDGPFYRLLSFVADDGDDSSLTSNDSSVDFGHTGNIVTKEDLDGVLSKLKSNKRLNFENRKEVSRDITKAVDQSYRNIMRVAGHLPTDSERKYAAGYTEAKFKSIYKQRAALQEAFEGDFVGQMMEGIDVPTEGLLSSKPLYDNLKAWAEKNIKSGDFQKAALKIIKDLKEHETEFTKGKVQDSNLRNQVEVFKDRLTLAFIELNPQLTPEDIKKLNRFGLKGTSQQQVIRDCFIDLGKVFIWPLQKAFEVLKPGEVRDEAVSAIRSGFMKLIIDPDKGNRLIATFKEIFTQITKAPLESMGAVGRMKGPFAAIANRPENVVFQEINKLEAQVVEERAEIDKVINDGLTLEGGIPEAQRETLLEKIAVYHENCQLLLAMMELKESLFVKGYVLLPHLAAGHGKEIHAQANVLMNHVAFAVDMRGVLEHADQVAVRMEEKGISAQNAYLSLVKGTPPKEGETIELSQERVEVEAEAAEKLERAGNWLQYARSRGDLSAPIYLADLICTSDRKAWSPENADRTFATAQMLLNESFKGGDYERRADAETAMRSLLRLRFKASVRNDRPMAEQTYNAHELIKGMKYVNSVTRFPTTAARETALRNQLLGLVLLGSQEAGQVILDQIDQHAKKGRVTAGDVLVLSELAAEGFPGAKERLQNVTQMKSFLDKVEKDAKKEILTSEAFRALASLAAHGNVKARSVLGDLNKGDSGFLGVFGRSYPPTEDEDFLDMAISNWAMSIAAGSSLTQIPSMQYDHVKGFKEFYDRYALSPIQIDFNIPPFKGVEVDLEAISDRAAKGKLTEKDVNNLVLAIGSGNREAILTLDDAIVKMAARHSEIQKSKNPNEVLKFAKWALGQAKSPDGLQRPLADQADNIKERYNKLFPSVFAEQIPAQQVQPEVPSSETEAETISQGSIDDSLLDSDLNDFGPPQAPMEPFLLQQTLIAAIERVNEKVEIEVESEYEVAPAAATASPAATVTEVPPLSDTEFLFKKMNEGGQVESEAFFTEMGRRFERGVVSWVDLKFLTNSLLSSENKVKADNLLRIIANAKTEGTDDYAAIANLNMGEKWAADVLLNEINTSLKPPSDPLGENSLLSGQPKAISTFKINWQFWKKSSKGTQGESL